MWISVGRHICTRKHTRKHRQQTRIHAHTLQTLYIYFIRSVMNLPQYKLHSCSLLSYFVFFSFSMIGMRSGCVCLCGTSINKHLTDSVMVFVKNAQKDTKPWWTRTKHNVLSRYCFSYHNHHLYEMCLICVAQIQLFLIHLRLDRTITRRHSDNI